LAVPFAVAVEILTVESSAAVYSSAVAVHIVVVAAACFVHTAVDVVDCCKVVAGFVGEIFAFVVVVDCGADFVEIDLVRSYFSLSLRIVLQAGPNLEQNFVKEEKCFKITPNFVAGKNYEVIEKKQRQFDHNLCYCFQ